MVTHAVSYDLLGFKITPTTIDQLIEIITENVEIGNKIVIVSQNLHGIYMYFKDRLFRKLHEDSFVHVDGMPIIWIGKLVGLGLRTEQRTDWISWFMPLMQKSNRHGWRVFYLGGDPEVLERGLDYVRAQCPGLQIAGHHGYFDAAQGTQENGDVVEAINAFGTNILIVGMGMGRQEHWILDNLDRLDVNFIGTSGACIEYFAGAVPTAPRWLGRIGLEWAYRLCSNPRRFWWRYMVEPWLAAWMILAHQARRADGRRLYRRWRDEPSPASASQDA